MDQFPVIDGELHVGGIPITRLAERAGQTPFYAYDRWLISDRVQLLRNTFPEALQLHYSIKANPMPALLHHLAGLVDGFDVASVAEMKLALDTAMPASNISFAGPGKTDRELREAIAAAITINMESAGEMHRIARLSGELGIRPRVAIRINPDFELKSSGMRMGGGAKPFGVDAVHLPAMLRELATLDLEFHGFHIFSGSQCLRHDAIIEAQQKTFELALRMAHHTPGPIRQLNIGGGLGIPYFPGEQRLALAPIGEHLEVQLANLKTALPEAKVIMELGRFIVGEAGLYVCKVIDKKVSHGETFLVTDGGLHHHLAASGNLGQVVRRNYPLIVGNKASGAATESVNVVGPLCTPLDILGSKSELCDPQEGDLIVIFQSGAYGLTASPERFLGHPPASEILV